ncbi:MULTISPECIES: hypothetical protein [Streptomyces]|uniref:Uncharacterized protein n=1 Tax=Streptomyces cellulosae TaxID=1968 RepID=A0ABW7YI99_STRCE
MDTATISVTIGSVIIADVFALLTLWLRLRWNARQEEAQQQYLLRAAEAVSVGGQLELDDQHPNGHRFRVKINRALPHKEVRTK